MKEIILYDTTDYSERYNDIREELYERFAEEYDWEYSDDVPMDMIHNEMNFQKQIDYQYFQDKLSQLLETGDCLLTGTCGRWNGAVQGGKFIHSFHDFSDAIRHLDYVKITDQNGHLIIEGFHHDGQDRYELKQLTAKGYEYANNNYFVHSRQLHETIMGCNFFSKLPHLATL